MNVNENRLIENPEFDLRALYQTVFDSTGESLLIMDTSDRIVMLNKSARKLLRIEDEHGDYNLPDILESVPAEVFISQLDQIRRNGSMKGEWETYMRSENLLNIHFTATYTQNHYFFTLADVTPYKKIEKDYLIWTSLFKEVFKQVTDGFIIMDKNGVIKECDGVFLSKIGAQRENVINCDFRRFICKDAAFDWQEEWRLIKEKGEIKRSVEIMLESKKFYFEYHTFLNDYNSHTITLFLDVTGKRQLEMELKHSQEIFKHLFNQAMDAIMITSDKGIIMQVNDSAAKMFEMDQEELIGEQISDFFPKKGKRYSEMVRKFYRNGEVRDEMFIQTAKGKQKMLEYTSKMIEDLNVNLTVYRNVSYRYEMEKNLKKSEKRFRTIFNEMPVGLVLWQRNLLYDINDAGLKILDSKKEKLLNIPIDHLLEAIPESKDAINDVISEMDGKNNVREIVPFHYPAGMTKHLEFSTKKNLVSNLNLTIIQDVTETLELQERLRKSDTLNVVGELAAGIAHEIRNPMTALKGFIQLLEGSVSGQFSNYFSIINSELKRIDEIITEFLVLAKPQAMQHKEKDIKEIMKETVGLLNAESILYNVMIESDYDEDPLPLYCEPNQLKQVFINVIKNAMEAMEETGGSISINIESRYDKMIIIKIEDQGSGIPEDKLKKLGEPFYTTKERGTGLGLMVSYKIIEEHHGRIEVESELGKGTAFTIILPISGKFE